MKTNTVILNEILEKVKPIDFMKRANLEAGKDKVQDKHYLITAIDEVLLIVKELNSGLAMQNGSIYVYNGSFWNLVEKKELMGFLGMASQKLGIGMYEARFYQFKDKLYRQFMEDAKIPIRNIDKTKVLINLQNGTFEFNSGNFILRDFDANDFLTYQLPFSYDENATCSGFMQYLNRVLPDNDLQMILAEFIGYLFLKDLKLEKCLLLHGSGANGKSVFFEIITALLGKENISSLSMGNLNDPNGRVQILNKLLNYGSELNAGDLKTETLKQMISGEPIECKHLYRDKFQSSDYARLMFNCNELPYKVEHNEAFFRRFLIIPFEVTIPENERNPRLAQIIIENELPGVFNWVLEGLGRLLGNNRFSESKAAKEALNDYRVKSDSVALFIEENDITKSDSQSAELQVIYASYDYFCKEHGYRACAAQTFSSRLRGLGFEYHRKPGGWHVFAKFNALPIKKNSFETTYTTSSTLSRVPGLFSEEVFGEIEEDDYLPFP